jgi:hypothetical protein
VNALWRSKHTVKSARLAAIWVVARANNEASAQSVVMNRLLIAVTAIRVVQCESGSFLKIINHDFLRNLIPRVRRNMRDRMIGQSIVTSSD